jgi:hypothetical protein
VTDAFVFLAATVAVTAVLCGHQGQPWPLAGFVRSAWTAVGPRRALDARLSAEQPSVDPESPGAADGHSEPPLHPSPSWARKDAA